MVTGLEEAGMGGILAAAGDTEDADATHPHLSVVQPDGAEAEGDDATIIEIAHVRPEPSQHHSLIFAW